MNKMCLEVKENTSGNKVGHQWTGFNSFYCFDLVDESLVRFMWVTEVLHDLCYHDRIDEKEVL